MEQQSESSDRSQSVNTAKPYRSFTLSTKLALHPSEELQQRFKQALETGAAEVFEMMVGTALGAAGDPSQQYVADYTSMIGLAGDLCGILSFRCSNESAISIAGKMLGSTEGVPDASVRDALGEICNMVAGSFKSQLTDSDIHCMLSVPTVVSGKDYQLYPLANGLRIQIAKTYDGALIGITLDLHLS